MSEARRANKFFCHDCDLGFEIFDPSLLERNARKYCPKCGDHFNVRVMKTNKKPGDDWDDYELKKLKEYMDGKIKLYNLVKMTGRSKSAIARQKYRINRENGIVEKELWSDEEKFYGDLYFEGKITARELSEKTGRSLEAAKCYKKNKKRKLKKQGEKAND